jgi:hypothetical protein
MFGATQASGQEAGACRGERSAGTFLHVHARVSGPDHGESCNQPGPVALPKATCREARLEHFPFLLSTRGEVALRARKTLIGRFEALTAPSISIRRKWSGICTRSANFSRRACMCPLCCDSAQGSARRGVSFSSTRALAGNTIQRTTHHMRPGDQC